LSLRSKEGAVAILSYDGFEDHHVVLLLQNSSWWHVQYSGKIRYGNFIFKGYFDLFL